MSEKEKKLHSVEVSHPFLSKTVHVGLSGISAQLNIAGPCV